MSKWIGVALAVAVAGCGSSNTGAAPTPVQAAPTVSSIAVTLETAVLLQGSTAKATGTVTLSNGGNQAITSGWRSDSPGVATVTDAGVVTAVGSGFATIYVVTGDRQGQTQVRVVPDYAGHWGGTMVATSCSLTGAVPANFCGSGRFFDAAGVALRYPRSLAVQQNADALTVRWVKSTSSITGEVVEYHPTTQATVAPNGLFESSGIAFPWPNTGLNYTETWTLNTSGNGFLTGTGVGRFRAPGSSVDAATVNLTVNRIRKGCPPTC